MTESELEHVYVLMYDHLGMCGCGYRDAAFDMVRDILNLAPLHKDERWRQVEKMIGNPGAHHIVLSAMQSAGLIEHGGSIDGSWLTDKGRWYQRVMAGITDWGVIDQVGYPHNGDDCTDVCWVGVVVA